jgi:hypothetical protein
MRGLFAASLLLFSPLVSANAPFCVVTVGFTNCIYYSVSACQQAARFSGGMCAANVQQQQQPPPIRVDPNAFSNAYSVVRQAGQDVQQGFDQGRERARQKRLADLASMYFGGQVTPENRARFLGDVAQAGGDAAWYRDDMESKDGQSYAPPPTSTPVPPSPTFTYFPGPSIQPDAAAPKVASDEAKDLEIQLLRTQLEQAKLDLAQARGRADPALAQSPGPSEAVGTFTGRKKRLPRDYTSSLEKWNCKYAVGGAFVWKAMYGACPSTVNIP